MFGSFMSSMNKVVEDAGGFDAVSQKGLGFAQSFLQPQADNSSKAVSYRDGDDAPQEDGWGSVQFNGNKKAVLVGINYRGQQGELRGCINDVKMMKQYISQEQGFPTDDDHMLILTEDEPEENHPTKARILEGMEWLVDGASEGDALFFHYSGHGTRVKDLDGDEEDGMDEAICPLDFRTANMIIDDVVNQILISKPPKGCRLTIIMDCCHSGTVCDLPYTFKASEQAMINWQQELPQMLMNHEWDFKNFQTILKTGTSFGKMVFEKYQATKNAPPADQDQDARFYREGSKAAMAEVVMFSGCQDAQTSADVYDTSTFTLPSDCGPGGAGGACTNAFISVLHGKPGITFVELLDSMRIMLAEKNFTQIPCLSSSRSVPLDAVFNMASN